MKYLNFILSLSFSLPFILFADFFVTFLNENICNLIDEMALPWYPLNKKRERERDVVTSLNHECVSMGGEKNPIYFEETFIGFRTNFLVTYQSLWFRLIIQWSTIAIENTFCQDGSFSLVSNAEDSNRMLVFIFW